jgi:hypothetical protein
MTAVLENISGTNFETVSREYISSATTIKDLETLKKKYSDAKDQFKSLIKKEDELGYKMFNSLLTAVEKKLEEFKKANDKVKNSSKNARKEVNPDPKIVTRQEPKKQESRSPEKVDPLPSAQVDSPRPDPQNNSPATLPRVAQVPPSPTQTLPVEGVKPEDKKSNTVNRLQF